MDKWRKKLGSKGKDRSERPTPSPSHPPSFTHGVFPNIETRLSPSGMASSPPAGYENDGISPPETETRADLERRRSSNKSTPSTFANLTIASSTREQSVSKSREANPLGLSVIWEPQVNRSLDIVLVHGLGGTSRSTWSKDHDLECFWPSLWLPSEPAIGSARILSFGYDADWRSTGSKTLLNITDFAKDEGNNLEDLRLGEVPIIFIVHSMGGLVVKKAYILGQSDDEYQDIVKSPKQYIADLQKNSPALEELNEEFRKIAPKLHIVSFYETLQTVVGPKKVMILEKESAILGYPGEISRAMNADHHNVCKYYSPRDSNYISIRDVLKTLVDRVRTMGTGLRRSSSDGSQLIETLLSILDRPDDDYNFFRDRWMPDTCNWILNEATFQDWLSGAEDCSVLWLHGLPASGKSVLSSFVINHIKERGMLCYFYFFRFSEQGKRSINSLLRSIAFQASQDLPRFRRQLKDLSEDGLRLEKADARSIWTRLFIGLLLSQREGMPLYWVIDALDEASSPQLLLELLTGLKKSRLPVRVLIVSRDTSAISLGFNELSNNIPVKALAITEKARNDIRLYVQQRMHFARWDPLFKQEISDKILHRADGNFLWVHLAISAIMKRHTIDDIRQALEHMPIGMEAMYHCMAADIAKDTGSMDRELAVRVLTWAMYSRKALTLRQLSEALKPQFNRIPDLRSTIPEICGFFVVVDLEDRVTMIHQTARDYLTRTTGMDLFVNIDTAHQDLFAHCMAYFMEPSVRSKLGQTRPELKRDFIQYAATSWPYHLSLIPKYAPSITSSLVQFLRGPSVLLWIQALASLHEIKVLVYASRYLAELTESKKLSRFEDGLQPHYRDFFRAWSSDLIKVAGKFGSTLTQDPSSIQRFIPDRCPKNSMLFKQFTKQKSFRSISISGVINKDWDDSVAHISIRKNQISQIICSRRHIAVVATNVEVKGLTMIWNTLNFDREVVLVQNEYITASCFNSSGSRYVSCGISKTKIWEIPSGRLLLVFDSPEDTAILGLTFRDEESAIVVASDDKVVRLLSLGSSEPEWTQLHSLREKDVGNLGYANSPCALEFNADGTHIAVAYRGFPLSVWSLEDRQLIGRCLRQVEGHAFNNTNWSSVDTMSWNHQHGSILGKYDDGCVFKWDPYDHMSQELRTAASTIECSPDGLSFATCDNYGIIRLYNYQTFSLVYQLQCHTIIKAFTFAPDSRRFYEVRDTVCTAWEPPALGELQEPCDQLDESWETESSSSTLVEVGKVVTQTDLMTALAVTSNGKVFCAGNEAGEVHLYARNSQQIMTVWSSPRMLMVDYVIWDDAGSHLGIVELGGDVVVKHLEPPSGHDLTKPWSIQSTLEIKTTFNIGGIRQLLFSRDGRYLLLAGYAFAQSWDLKSGTLLGACEMYLECGTSWINDPHEPDLLIAFDHRGTRRFEWKTLAGGPLMRYQEDNHVVSEESVTQSGPSESDSFKVEARITQDQWHVIVDIKEGTDSSRCLLITISDLKNIPPPTGQDMHKTLPQTYAPVFNLPNSIHNSVEMALGVLPRKRFVFLDQDLWVCTWNINTDNILLSTRSQPVQASSSQAEKLSTIDSVKRHFALPRDWINEDSLPLLYLARDGTLFFPKGGEIAVIETRLGIGW